MPHKNWILRFTGLALILAFTFSMPTMAENPKDAVAIKGIVNQLIGALNTMDEGKIRGAFSNFSSSMGTLYLAGGTVRVSDRQSNPLAGLEDVSARTYEATSPIIINTDKTSGWATYEWKAERHMTDGSHQESAGRTTLIFVKENKTWKIKHVHASVPTAPTATAADHSAAGETVLAMERAIWEAIKNGDIGSVAGYFSESVTVLESSATYRLTGKDNLLRSFDDMVSDIKLVGYQMLDPKVEIHGGAAILTYYFTQSVQTGGRTLSQSGKNTTVFADEEGEWRVVHHHSTTNPAPQESTGPQRDYR